MPRARLRFTVRRMMAAVAALAIVAWSVAGVAKLGLAGLYDEIVHPPCYVALAYPFLVAALLALVASLAQETRRS